MDFISSLGTTLLSSFRQSTNATYNAAEDDGKDDDSDTAFFVQDVGAMERKRQPLSAKPWIIATILYTIITIVMWFNLARPIGELGSYELGWVTDFGTYFSPSNTPTAFQTLMIHDSSSTGGNKD